MQDVITGYKTIFSGNFPNFPHDQIAKSGCSKQAWLIFFLHPRNFISFTLSFIQMQKYHVTIQFEMSDEFMELVPPHRTYINYLINKGTIDHYAVSMETQRSWITLNAENKKEVEKLLKKSPLFKFWTFEIDELFVLDGQHYRLPEVNPN